MYRIRYALIRWLAMGDAIVINAGMDKDEDRYVIHPLDGRSAYLYNCEVKS